MTKNKLATARPIDILIAEDSPADVMLMREALQHAKVLNTLHVVDNGVEAMEFLRRIGKYREAPRPDLILLDLNMPRKNGQEVLAEIKDDESLRAIPVIILTTSRTDADIAAAYGGHANCYIAKPVDFDAFAEVVRSIQSFWFTVVTLPPV
jgi:chemotaxis family two-component system response regulator Rcp1